MKIIGSQELKVVSDVPMEQLGYVLGDGYGREFRYVKNSGDTALSPGLPVMCKNMAATAPSTGIGGVPATSPLDTIKYVENYDDNGGFDAGRFAGLPLTTIAVSGGNCYGYIQVAGIYEKNAKIFGPLTAINAGELLIATSTGGFATPKVYLGPATALNGTHNTGVRLLQPTTSVASGCGMDGIATAGTRMVSVRGLSF